jgi:putative thioredoxin
VLDLTDATFEDEVLRAAGPVVVDFWAPWCGPCKTLGPVLERLEREYGGRWRLVNVNSDTNPELVSSFSLKSIPYVVAFVDGNAVAQFMGSQPEPYLRAFLDRLIPNPSELEHRSAREAIAKGQSSIAVDKLKAAIALDPSNDAARLDIASSLLDEGDVGGAREHFDLLSSKAERHYAYSATRARLEAMETAAVLPPAEQLHERIEQDEGDLEARLELADVHIARRDFGAALAELLEIVQRDRNFGDDIGRRKMVEVFEMAADQPELIEQYRSKLSLVLF